MPAYSWMCWPVYLLAISGSVEFHLQLLNATSKFSVSPVCSMFLALHKNYAFMLL